MLLYRPIPYVACLLSCFAGSAYAAVAPISDTPTPEPASANGEAAPATENEQWSIHGQSTYIWQQKNNFNSPYYGDNSLLNKTEGDGSKSYTWSVTAFLGARLWEGAEIYYNPEMFEGTPFSGQLVGLGGFQNGELQKGAFAPPVYYNARLFLRQTFGLGGGQERIEGTANQLAGTVDKNRVVLTYGKFATLDIFDQNSYSHDPRTQFMNFAIFSMGAYSYAADAKGYTYGLVGEWYQDDWTLRLGRTAVPTQPNTNTLDWSLRNDYVDQAELDHDHTLWGQPGVIRALIYQQHAFMATYNNAIAQGYQLGLTPDILTARTGYQNSWGYGFNIEQAVNDDIGLFARWSWNPGQTETQTLDMSRSLSSGASIKGTRWHRPNDTLGLGFAVSGISAAEINYLSQGGMTMFIGDGALQYRTEQVAEAYYNAHVYKGFSVGADVQHIANPAYNSARGPVNFIGLRAHVEF